MTEYPYVKGFENGEAAIIPFIMPDDMDKIAWEKLFHTIPQEQLEVLVCLYLGMRPKEIVKTLQYPSIVRFYNMTAKLRETYRQQKHLFLA
jgi:hypothetical protein